MWDDDFKAPTQYYIVEPMGNGVYFRTRDRMEAQRICDEIYGKGFFTVKMVLKASVH